MISPLEKRIPQRVVVVRALPGLGDMLCIIPALRSLRMALPHAKITLIGLASANELVKRFAHYIDDFLELPGYPGLPERSPQIEQIPSFLHYAQSQRFDLAIQMHGSGLITNPLTQLLGACATAGLFLSDQYCHDHDRFLPFLPHESEVRRYLNLLEFLGFPAQGEDLEFPLYETDRAALWSVEAVQSKLMQDYVCIHPGASETAKRWSPQQFATVADAIASRGLQIVLTGSIEELEITQAIADLTYAPALNLAGCTSLGALAALLSQSHLLVCNDTGVSHLAAALKIPSVVVFSNSDPQRWAPLNRDRHRVVIKTDFGVEATTDIAIAQAIDLLSNRDVYVIS